MNDHQSRRLSRRDVIEIFFRHKKKIVLLPLVAIALGVLTILYFPRTYRSVAQVFLRLGRENIGLDPTATTGQSVLTQQTDRKDEVASVINVIQSRGVIEQAVDQVGVDAVLSGSLTKTPEPNWLVERISVPLKMTMEWFQQIDPITDRERALVKAERNLFASADRGSTLISISYDAKTPQAAQAVCSAILDVYQKEHMRIQRSEDSRPFFTEQYERLRKQLDDSLEALRSAKSEMGLASVDQRRETLEAQYSAVELARLSTQQQLATADARIAELERRLADTPERLVDSKKSMPNSGADLLRQQLYNLQMRSMDLEARYSDAHPLVMAVNEQEEEARRVLAQQADERLETTDSINPIHRQLSLDLKLGQSEQAGLKTTLTELHRQKESVLTELRAVNKCELQLDRLTRQVEIARSNYMHYAQNMEEARLDKELEADRISNLSVVHGATLAEKPVSPSIPLIALATLMLATAGTAAVVVVCEALNDRLRTEDDIVRELELPVLTTIPHGRVHRFVPPVAQRPKVMQNGHSR